MIRKVHVAAVAAVLLVACSDEGPISGPGTMAVTLSGPNGPEGAAVLALLGDGIGDVAPAGVTEVWSRAGDEGVQIVLVNEAGGDLSFHVAVADTTDPPAWTIEEVAGPDDELRPGLERYVLSFSSIPEDAR